MKIAIACFSLIVLAVSAFAQTERQILVTPNAEHPQAAKDSGLGGRVTVYVTVDPAGNVVAVGDVIGPGNVCPSVTRADVVALRESARTAAASAKFAPSENPNTSSLSLNFDFPLSSKRRFEVTGEVEESGSKDLKNSANRFTVMGDREYAATNTPPPDYKGPVTVSQGGGGGSVPTDSQTLSGGVLNGKAMSLPRPPYPPAARAVRAAGAVNIQVLIMEDGSVFSAAAVSGHPLLRMAARSAACGAAFSPTTLSGNPVKVSGVITYNFIP